MSAGGLALASFVEPKIGSRLRFVEDGTAFEIFAGTSEQIARGSFENTTLDPQQQGIVLQHSSAGQLNRRGTYLSSPIPIAGGGRVQIAWKERWTTPVVWAKDSRNPVLTPENLGQPGSVTVTTPFIIRKENEKRLYFGLRPKGIGMVASEPNNEGWRTSLDLVLKAAPSDDAFDGGGVNAPFLVQVTDTHWRMYYVGYHPTAKWGHMPVHQIGLAESEDGGITWRRTSKDPVVPHGPAGSYDAFAASAGSVLRVGGEWWMWYGGISQVPYLAGVCLAISRDGISWKKYPANPVLNHDPKLKYEAFIVAKPFVVFEDGLFKMWYSAVGYSVGAQRGGYHICYAESQDGIRWDRFSGNPVMEPSSSGWDNQMDGYPTVLRTDDSYEMWFCGDGYGKIGHAIGKKDASISVQTRLRNDQSSTSSWSEWNTVRNNSAIGIPPGRHHWLQFRLTMEMERSAPPPVVQHITIHKLSRG